MNSKIKMVLGVLLVFALLSPIYAIETPIDILPHDPIVDPEDGTDDNESDLVDKIEFPRLGDFPDSPGSIVGKPIVGPEDGTDDNESDLPDKIKFPESPGLIVEKPDKITVDPILVGPEITVYNQKIITKENSIEVKGSLKEAGLNVTYNIPETNKSGSCRVEYSTGTIDVAPDLRSPQIKFSAIDDNPSIISPIEKDPRPPVIDPISPVITTKITFDCNIDVPNIEGEYKVNVVAKKSARYRKTEKIDLIVDRTAPEVTVDSISTRDRNPILTGTARDNLTDIKALTITINGVNYQPEADEDGTWEVQLDTLPRGTHNVKIYAKDEAKNTYIDETENGAIVIRSAGGGTRIVAETPAPTVQANAPAPAPVGPIVVTQPTPVVNTPTTPTTPTTGGTPTTTPTETTPITGNVTAVNPTGTSGATGFLGLPSTSAGTMGMIVGALLVIGAIGYFFFFRK